MSKFFRPPEPEELDPEELDDDELDDEELDDDELDDEELDDEELDDEELYSGDESPPQAVSAAAIAAPRISARNRVDVEDAT